MRSASTSCSSTASRTDSVIAETVSSVVESGSAPSVGTRRAVLLKPTRPCSAAGMRIEPPVSEPSAAQAAPVATETAPPEVEPPGNARRRVEPRGRRVGRRAVVRIDADAGEGELRHVGAADEGGAGAAQARDRGRVVRRGGCVGERGRSGAVGSPSTSNRSLIETASRRDGPVSRPAATARSAAAAAARAPAKSVARKAWAQAADPAAAIDCSIRAAAPTAARHDVVPGVSQVGAHRGCYNRVLCPGQTNGRIFRSGVAARPSCKDSRTGSFKVLRAAISDPRTRTAAASRFEPGF